MHWTAHVTYMTTDSLSFAPVFYYSSKVTGRGNGENGVSLEGLSFKLGIFGKDTVIL